ncbi:preprotein translocase subunit SecY [Prochlorococcus marinus XMU1403]|jgi:preprotein translocase subunit SecY|uniref:preprotein translocase subunit SecY n=1 Tax=Prochlorococcus marinus TaxID=1219 RepID=UPI000D8246FF|nr:preprotein translocase subunit SecY [Prochlorococcus marinus]MBW3050169.1 preprotein translocase subunit SecY [Prochlorococcus marinus str. MU1403]PYE00359.1 preprotein translocase subunit SecY [Prochlorococcus marinus XMU1403]|tara:strand:+ start:1344 stop:2663 length:1320 start_codon:yes stop_codon:yes gene_type:complete
MLISRGRNPSAGEVITQLFSNEELRGRVFTTLGLLLIVRLGIYIPMPGIDREAFKTFIDQGGQLIGFLDIFTGGGISTLGVFALGILPFINASIIIQLLTASLPQLEDLQKNEGEAGRRKIAQITRYVALGWGLVQSTVFALILRQYAVEGISETEFVIQTSLALVTGSMIVMWLSEIITEKGIGQGASLVIFLNIVATLPKALSSTIEKAQTGDRADVLGIIILLIVFLITIVGIIFVQEGARRIPIVSAKSQMGGVALLPSRQSYLPLKLNAGGVMPIIFASALIFLPITIANFTQNPLLIKAASSLNPGSSNPWPYAITFFALILGFAYFYASLTINPLDIASNLKKGGVAIPGVRPGGATSNYLSGVQNRLTLLGGLFLGSVAIVPAAVERATNVQTFQGLGATSLLILVGVAIDTSKQIQTYVISQRYEGLVRQ